MLAPTAGALTATVQGPWCRSALPVLVMGAGQALPQEWHLATPGLRGRWDLAILVGRRLRAWDSP